MIHNSEVLNKYNHPLILTASNIIEQNAGINQFKIRTFWMLHNYDTSGFFLSESLITKQFIDGRKLTSEKFNSICIYWISCICKNSKASNFNQALMVQQLYTSLFSVSLQKIENKNNEAYLDICEAMIPLFWLALSFIIKCSSYIYAFPILKEVLVLPRFCFQ